MRTLRDLEVTNGGLYDKIIDAQKKGGPAAVGGIYDKVWPALAYLALVLGLVAFAIIYSNTGKRFRK